MRRATLSIGLALALAGCGGHGHSAPPGGHVPLTAAPGRAQLVGMLGVLRRAQRAGDLDAGLRARLARVAATGSCWALPVDTTLVRRAIAGRHPVFVVPFGAARCQPPPCTGTARSCMRPPPRVETVELLGASGPATPFSVAYLAPGDIARGLGVYTVAPGAVAQIVPDGVRRVAVTFATAGARQVAVRDNVAAWTGGYPTRLRWYDGAGRLIRSIP